MSNATTAAPNLTPINAPVNTPTPSAAVELTPANPSITVTAPTSSVAVTAPNTSVAVRFQLVVTDNLGQESAPAYATVSVQGPPVAVLTATPGTVQAGNVINLSAAGSSSGGSIASYKFSLVPAAG